MAKTTNKTSSLTSEEILGRFVVRARRVEDHSLVKSGDIERYATPRMTFSVTETGSASIQHHVCTDEEAIESLATRLRPSIVRSEPIYLPKILDAICAQAPAKHSRKTKPRFWKPRRAGSPIVTRKKTANATGSSL